MPTGARALLYGLVPIAAGLLTALAIIVVTRKDPTIDGTRMPLGEERTVSLDRAEYTLYWETGRDAVPFRSPEQVPALDVALVPAAGGESVRERAVTDLLRFASGKGRQAYAALRFDVSRAGDYRLRVAPASGLSVVLGKTSEAESSAWGLVVGLLIGGAITLAGLLVAVLLARRRS